MDTRQVAQQFQKIQDMWNVLRTSYFPDEPEWETGIDLIISDLHGFLQVHPAHLDARVLLVRLIGDGLGAYAEAFMEADTLTQQFLDNQEYRVLRERMRQKAKTYWPNTPDQ